MGISNIDEAGRVFVTPAAYADERHLHEALAVLREHDPIHRVEEDGYPSFFAITRHADVREISTNNAAFHNAPRSILEKEAVYRAREEDGAGALRTLIDMDAPDHRAYRALATDWFLPTNLASMEPRLDQLALESVQRMVELDGRCDFARDIAGPFPLQVILSILGLPVTDYPMMAALTQQLFGDEDPELQRAEGNDGFAAVVAELFAYFGNLAEERRANPTGDLGSVIATATIDGRLLEPMELLSYYVIVATAGHDTTSSTIAGGLLALAERPEELRRVQRDPSLIPTMVEEMIRWVTPVKHFMRTAVEPVTLASGQQFEAGDFVLLSYPSANRDEAVFDDPFRFDSGRTPNRHLAFGAGAHHCLGAALARLEAKAFFSALLPRLEEIDLDGEQALVHTTFVGGLKRLPIRYRLSS